MQLRHGRQSLPSGFSRRQRKGRKQSPVEWLESFCAQFCPDLCGHEASVLAAVQQRSSCKQETGCALQSCGKDLDVAAEAEAAGLRGSITRLEIPNLSVDLGSNMPLITKLAAISDAPLAPGGLCTGAADLHVDSVGPVLTSPTSAEIASSLASSPTWISSTNSCCGT